MERVITQREIIGVGIGVAVTVAGYAAYSAVNQPAVLAANSCELSTGETVTASADAPLYIVGCSGIL